MLSIMGYIAGSIKQFMNRNVLDNTHDILWNTRSIIRRFRLPRGVHMNLLEYCAINYLIQCERVNCEKCLYNGNCSTNGIVGDRLR